MGEEGHWATIGEQLREVPARTIGRQEEVRRESGGAGSTRIVCPGAITDVLVRDSVACGEAISRTGKQER